MFSYSWGQSEGGYKISALSSVFDPLDVKAEQKLENLTSSIKSIGELWAQSVDDVLAMYN